MGQDLLTVPESVGYTLLYPLLANRLADYLKVSPDGLPDGAELNEVACRYLAQGRPAQQIYTALKMVATEAESLPLYSSSFSQGRTVFSRALLLLTASGPADHTHQL